MSQINSTQATQSSQSSQVSLKTGKTISSVNNLIGLTTSTNIQTNLHQPSLQTHNNEHHININTQQNNKFSLQSQIIIDQRHQSTQLKQQQVLLKNNIPNQSRPIKQVLNRDNSSLESRSKIMDITNDSKVNKNFEIPNNFINETEKAKNQNKLSSKTNFNDQSFPNSSTENVEYPRTDTDIEQDNEDHEFRLIGTRPLIDGGEKDDSKSENCDPRSSRSNSLNNVNGENLSKRKEGNILMNESMNKSFHSFINQNDVLKSGDGIKTLDDSNSTSVMFMENKSELNGYNVNKGEGADFSSQTKTEMTDSQHSSNTKESVHSSNSRQPSLGLVDSDIKLEQVQTQEIHKSYIDTQKDLENKHTIPPTLISKDSKPLIKNFNKILLSTKCSSELISYNTKFDSVKNLVSNDFNSSVSSYGDKIEGSIENCKNSGTVITCTKKLSENPVRKHHDSSSNLTSNISNTTNYKAALTNSKIQNTTNNKSQPGSKMTTNTKAQTKPKTKAPLFGWQDKNLEKDTETKASKLNSNIQNINLKENRAVGRFNYTCNEIPNNVVKPNLQTVFAQNASISGSPSSNVIKDVVNKPSRQSDEINDTSSINTTILNSAQKNDNVVDDNKGETITRKSETIRPRESEKKRVGKVVENKFVKTPVDVVNEKQIPSQILISESTTKTDADKSKNNQKQPVTNVNNNDDNKNNRTDHGTSTNGPIKPKALSNVGTSVASTGTATEDNDSKSQSRQKPSSPSTITQKMSTQRQNFNTFQKQDFQNNPSSDIEDYNQNKDFEQIKNNIKNLPSQVNSNQSSIQSAGNASSKNLNIVKMNEKFNGSDSGIRGPRISKNISVLEDEKILSGNMSASVLLSKTSTTAPNPLLNTDANNSGLNDLMKTIRTGTEKYVESIIAEYKQKEINYKNEIVELRRKLQIAERQSDELKMDAEHYKNKMNFFKQSLEQNTDQNDPGSRVTSPTNDNVITTSLQDNGTEYQEYTSDIQSSSNLNGD